MEPMRNHPDPKKNSPALGGDQNRHRLFSALEVLVEIPSAEKERLLALLKPQLLAKGDYFVRGGETARRIGLVERGLLRYFYLSDDGRDFTRAFHREGQFVTSMTAFLSGEPSSYFIQALEETELQTLEYRDWAGLQEAHPVWSLLNTRLLEASVLRAERRERSLILDKAESRYQSLLEELPDIERRVRQHDIASYLGITPVFLSRIRGRPAKK